jgi:ribulose bisphosphate carboxylase small subunit
MKASFREPYLRLYVAKLLGLTGDSRALKELERVEKDDENHRVRLYAIWPYKQFIDRKHLAQ